MRILILAHPRSGSTVLGYWLSNELQYLCFLECWGLGSNDWDVYYPMNSHHELTVIPNDNVVVKEMIGGNYMQRIDWMNDGWDRIIRLVREDTYDAAISAVRCYSTYKWGGLREQYKLPIGFVESNLDAIKSQYMGFTSDSNRIKAMDIGLLVTYESIYCENNSDTLNRIKEYIGKEGEWKYTNMLHPQNRYRKPENWKRNII